MPTSITASAIPAWIDMDAIADSDLRQRITTLTIELRGDFVNLEYRLNAATALLEEAEKSRPAPMNLYGSPRRGDWINDATGAVWQYFSGVTDLHSVLCDLADLCGRASEPDIEVSK